MKKQLAVMSIMVCLMALPARVKAQDPVTAVILQGITKVIRAVDLKIQRLQNKTIWLQNAQKVMENGMSKLKLDEITGWVERQRVLYRDYFQELWKVKDLLAYYHRIRDLTDKQLLLVKEYKQAWKGARQDGHFTAEEIEYIGSVYAGIIEESLKNLEQVSLVINSFTTQMTDASRLKIIDAAANAIDQHYNNLKTFNNQTIGLSISRAKDAHDVALVKNLYGIR